MNISKTNWIKGYINNPRGILLGDNLQILKELHKEFDQQVNLIYIDPPYNRGDKYSFYSDNKAHDEWLSQMKNVLLELKPFLKSDGSIWISIDDSEMAYLKIICDEVFGRANFITTIVWQKRNTRENRKIFSNVHEYILVYSPEPLKFKKKRHLLPATPEVLARYKNPDNDPRGPWQSVTLNVQAGHAVKTQFYTIISPTGVKHDPPQGRCWIYNEDRMREEIKKNNVWFGKDGTSTPRLKKFLSNSTVGLVPNTLWTSEFAGTNKDAKNELLKLNIYEKKIFDTPKPEKLIYQILNIATDVGDLVLDCYLGSGTTTAVAHKMNRNYIGIEKNRDAMKYVTSRMDKVILGDKGGISKLVKWTGGGQYQYCDWIQVEQKPTFFLPKGSPLESNSTDKNHSLKRMVQYARLF